MSQRQAHRRKWSAISFTLIELLVVIAIIALLAALLLPALRSARERAKQVTCISRIRQLAMAVQLYADDYNNYFPAICDSTSITSFFPFCTPWQYRVWQLHYLPIAQSAVFPDTSYPSSMNIFVCPSWEVYKNSQFINFSRTLAMFQYLPSRAHATNPQPRVAVQEASGTPLVGDGIILAGGDVQWYAIDAIGGTDHLLHFRHFGKADVGWVDGSARAVSGGQYSDELRPPLSQFINYYYQDGQLKTTTPHN